MAVIHGSNGNDDLAGFSGQHWAIVDGQNVLYPNGDDTIYGDDGDDTIRGWKGIDTIYGDDGDDVLHGHGETEGVEIAEYNENYLYGGDGDDTLRGSWGDDVLDGGAGNDNLWGGDLYGDDTLDGGAGNDTLQGLFGSDLLDGGKGNDILNGSFGSDTVNGESGDDILDGYLGNDLLNGGSGNDILSGLLGDDTLIGGAGNDELTGGVEADVFQFDSPSEGIDTITDFNLEENDEIHINRRFEGGLTEGVLDPSQFTIGVGAADKSDRLIYNSDKGYLFFDVDGTGEASPIQIANMSSGLDLTSDNFAVF